MDTPNWQTIELPVEIPELTVVPTHAHVFMFSAATWNRHRIHYSKDAAIEEGHPDVVVQRALLGNYLTRMVLQWFNGAGELNRLQWKVVKSAIPGQPLTCQGTVQEVHETSEENLANCDIRIVSPQGELIATGTAIIAFTK